MIRNLIIAGLAISAAACTSTGPRVSSANPPAITPTQRYSMTVNATPDEIQLAPHASGLSGPQAAALAALVERWRSAGGGGPIVIRAPSRGSPDVMTAANLTRDGLHDLGVDDAQIRLVGSDADPKGPIVVGFERYDTRPLKCGRIWESFTRTGANQPNSNFGCAVTANMAAMIANPADLAAPRPVDPADATRRENELAKYRAGAVTSAAKDEQADATVSSVIK